MLVSPNDERQKGLDHCIRVATEYRYTAKEAGLHDVEDLAEKAIAQFERAKKFSRPTGREYEARQTGLQFLKECERLLKKATTKGQTVQDLKRDIDLANQYRNQSTALCLKAKDANNEAALHVAKAASKNACHAVISLEMSKHDYKPGASKTPQEFRQDGLDAIKRCESEMTEAQHLLDQSEGDEWL